MGSWVEHTFRKIVGVKAKKMEVDAVPSWDGDYEAQKQVERFQVLSLGLSEGSGSGIVLVVGLA